MPSQTETAIGVDVGGTRIRVGRVTRDGHIQDHLEEPVEAARAEFTNQLFRMVNALRDEATNTVGVGIPGRVDARAGRVASAGYLDIAGLPLADIGTREFGCPTWVENDATMALIAECAMRAGADTGVFAMVTIGTGIGGAIVEDGAPWYGGTFAGQFGHIVVSGEGPTCNCGRQGCVETFSSGTALGHLVKQHGLDGRLRAATLLDQARAGNQQCADVLVAWAAPLQRAIDTLIATLDPRTVILGGGLGAEMTQALDLLSEPKGWFTPRHEAARLGDKAGVIGAALCALRRSALVG